MMIAAAIGLDKLGCPMSAPRIAHGFGIGTAAIVTLSRHDRR